MVEALTPSTMSELLQHYREKARTLTKEGMNFGGAYFGPSIVAELRKSLDMRNP